MRLITFEKQKKQRLGIWLKDGVIDLQNAISILPGIIENKEEIVAGCSNMLALLNEPAEIWSGLLKLEPLIINDRKRYLDSLLREKIFFPLDHIDLLAPIPVPGKVICVAGNYPAPGISHKPDYPNIFLKPSSSVTGPNKPIWASMMTKNIAYEVELAVVMGRQAHLVSRENAMQYIAGYTLANDVGDRVLEKRSSQWTSGKMFNSFTPMGPWLITKDEVPHPGTLEMSTFVNEKVVQKGNTSEMFFDISELISILSSLTTLVPGDVILTGSPKMMGEQPNPTVFLSPGDRVTIKIDILGELTNPVREEL